MKRALPHIIFWMVYLVQNILLVFLLNTTRMQIGTGFNLWLSLQNCLVLLLPKMLFTYFVLHQLRTGFAQKGIRATGILKLIAVMSSAILVYRFLTCFVVDPIIYDWHRPTTEFFYPLAFPVAFMDIGFVAGIAAAITQARQQITSKRHADMLVREKLETELKYLKSQTNPHFLFNTLNNIYALARKRSENTADAVMKLSNLLRFMLYDAAKKTITIGEEIRLLTTYLDLEKIRYNDRLRIDLTTEVSSENECLAPMLLLPFVENAFKHGASESRFSPFIEIHIKLNNGILDFRIRNSKEPGQAKTDTGTIGLANVRRQLQLLYKEYDMKVIEGDTVFEVSLTINLKSNAQNELSDR